MIRLLLNGCNGKMGQTITRVLKEYENFTVSAGVTRDPLKIQNPYPVYKSFKEVETAGVNEIDIVMDFSNPEMLPTEVQYCVNHRKALVVGTTGLSDSDHELLKQASETIPVFYSANMTFGIRVLVELALKAASTLGMGFDIEIMEKHHREKKDAPSGTAIMIANELRNHIDSSMELVYDRTKRNEKRKSNEIGISSIRGGTFFGEHTIYFAGTDEVIEMKHTALSRDVLARGALRASAYISTKEKGFYNMKTMLEEMIS